MHWIGSNPDNLIIMMMFVRLPASVSTHCEELGMVVSFWVHVGNDNSLRDVVRRLQTLPSRRRGTAGSCYQLAELSCRKAVWAFKVDVPQNPPALPTT